MNKKKTANWLSILTVFAVLLSCLAVSMPSSAVADTTQDRICAAAAAYVAENQNASTPAGLLAEVRKVNANVTLDGDTDFFIKHAVPGVTDTDTSSGYPLNIPGTDGAVAAVFKLDGQSIGFSAAFAHQKECISIQKPIVITKTVLDDAANGFTYETKNGIYFITGYTGDADKLIFPQDFPGTVVEFSDKAAIQKVKVVYIDTNLTENEGRPANANKWSAVRLQDNAFKAWNGLRAVQFGPNAHQKFFVSNQATDTYDGSNPSKAYENDIFANCENLKYFKFPETLTAGHTYLLGSGLFDHCTSLENVIFPKTFDGSGQYSIETKAFAYTNVYSFFLPAYVKSAGEYEKDIYAGSACRTQTTGQVIDYTEEMTFCRAAALAAIAANSSGKDLGAQPDDVLAAIKREITGSANAESFRDSLTYGWNGTFASSIGSNSGTLSISKGTETIGVLYNDVRTLNRLDVGYTLSPAFDVNTLEYTVSVPSSVTSLTIDAVAANNAQVLAVTGNADFAIGSDNIVTIPVKLSESETVTYILHVTRNSAFTVDDVAELAVKAAADFASTNATTKDSFEQGLGKALASTGYTLTIKDFYICKSVGGAKDLSGVLVPGHAGTITAVAEISLGTEKKNITLMNRIAPAMKDYSFSADEIAGADDFQISADGKILEYYTGDAKKIVIPDGVEVLDAGWFDGDMKNAQVLIIPDSVVDTCDMPLCYAMPHLEVVYIGNGLTEVAASSFSGCYMLQYVHLSENTKTIGGHGFYQTLLLSEIYIPASVTEIGGSAFRQSGVRNYVLSTNVEELARDCLSLPGTGANDSQNLQNLLAMDASYQADVDRVNALMSSYKSINPVVTILNPHIFANAPYASNATGNPGTITVSYAPAAAKEGFTEEHKQCQYHWDLDMNLLAVAAQARSASENLHLTTRSTADDVVKALKLFYHTTTVFEPVWTQAFTVADGKATGVLQYTADGLSFEITIDQVAHEELGEEDPGKEEPGQDDPNKEDPGHDDPGKEEPSQEKPSQEKPADDAPINNASTGVTTHTAAAVMLMLAAVAVIVSARKPSTSK